MELVAEREEFIVRLWELGRWVDFERGDLRSLGEITFRVVGEVGCCRCRGHYFGRCMST